MFNFKKILPVTAILIIMSLTSCGSWVDLPGPLNYGCTDKKIDQFKNAKNKAMGNMIFAAACKKEGKEYAGDIRCNGDKLQVKCK